MEEKTITLADAKAHLRELTVPAAAGETVIITKRGKPVARMSRPERAREPIDLDALRRLTASMPPQAEGAAVFMRRVKRRALLMLYLDTSVLVAALTNESQAAQMQEWLANQHAGDLVISDWVMT